MNSNRGNNPGIDPHLQQPNMVSVSFGPRTSKNAHSFSYLIYACLKRNQKGTSVSCLSALRTLPKMQCHHYLIIQSKMTINKLLI